MADYQLDAEAQALVDSGAYVVQIDDNGAPFLMPSAVVVGKATRDFGAGWPPAKSVSEPPLAAPAASEDPPPAAASSTDGQEAPQDGGNVAPVVPPAEEGNSGSGAVPAQG